MKSSNRVFYVGMIATDSYGRSVGDEMFAGAAARKMTTVARAMRSVGLRAIIVSLPFVGSKAKRSFYRCVVTYEDGVPFVFVETMRSKYLRKLFGPFILAGFTYFHIRPADTVIFYNHSFEYLLALISLKLRGVKVVQDIEDAPAKEQWGLREGLNRLCFGVMLRLTDKRKLVVANHVADRLGLNDYVAVPGVALQPHETPPATSNKWEELRKGGDLTLHFGGTLIFETGLDLFCEAVEILVRDELELPRGIVFKVTGVGALDRIRALQLRIEASKKIRVEIFGALSKSDYAELLETCHGSLSLKRPESSMGDTTFPSKVIEITATGLALISTRLGDVVSIFNEDSAFFLRHYEPMQLARIFVEMAHDPARAERVAKAGFNVCNYSFSMKKIGEEIAKLL